MNEATLEAIKKAHRTKIVNAAIGVRSHAESANLIEEVIYNLSRGLDSESTLACLVGAKAAMDLLQIAEDIDSEDGFYDDES